MKTNENSTCENKTLIKHNEKLSDTSNFTQNESAHSDHSLVWTPNQRCTELKNYQTNQSLKTTGPYSKLYSDCRHQVCTLTLMSLAARGHNTQTNGCRTHEELQSTSIDYIRKEAHDFLSIYHKEKHTSLKDYETRVKEVDNEIDSHGIYSHTSSEIEYGCQLAWRNSPRCINRLFWKTLKVIDRRHVKTNAEMFSAICDYMREAFNQGSLQAMALVMGRQARMWSTQYLRFACYEQPDGSLLGDPMNHQLTKIAMKLGWNKPINERTEWDPLPIIVQCDPNTCPSWFPLPQDLCPIVFLSHPDPKYNSAIQSLGMRWFAQPTVADKAIEIGGIVYKCVPFSGWFMGTEIGRDLCDVQRYNFIPKLADKLGLDVTLGASSQLQIDRIYVEVNVSILYSFQRAKVTIVDHHSASLGFMQFMQQEVKERGNTPADWVWLVAPLSSGMNVLFHQEMLNYTVTPRILDQEEPWKSYASFQRRRNTNLLSDQRCHRLWTLLRCAFGFVLLSIKVMRKRTLITVLFASTCGTTKSYAEQTMKRLSLIGYGTNIMSLDEYSFDKDNDREATILIITSTFGQGNAPEGGRKTELWLKDHLVNLDKSTSVTNSASNGIANGEETIKQSNETSLKRCRYAVCAIGSSAYPFFCGFGKLIDNTFQYLGARQLSSLTTCDALSQQYKTYNKWEENIITILKELYPSVHAKNSGQNLISSISQTNSATKSSEFQQRLNLYMLARPNYIPLRYSSISSETHNSKNIGPFNKENPYIAIVLDNVELVGYSNASNDYTRLIHHQKQDIQNRRRIVRSESLMPAHTTSNNKDEPHSVRLIVLQTIGLFFSPGDHVCILPENTLDDVNAVIRACGWKLNNKLLDAPCSLATLNGDTYKTLRQILTCCIDLTTTPRPHTLGVLATYATDAKEQKRLLRLAKGGQVHSIWSSEAPTVKQILSEFPSIKIPLEELIQILPPLQPRYYSISSSDRLYPDQLHITVSVVTYITPRGICRKGLCSNYLQQKTPLSVCNTKEYGSKECKRPGEVRLFISKNQHFRLPGQEDLTSSLSLYGVDHHDLYRSFTSPLLMLAIGSGIAPFRSFWQELQSFDSNTRRLNVQRVLLWDVVDLMIFSMPKNYER